MMKNEIAGNGIFYLTWGGSESKHLSSTGHFWPLLYVGIDCLFQISFLHLWETYCLNTVNVSIFLLLIFKKRISSLFLTVSSTAPSGFSHQNVIWSFSDFSSHPPITLSHSISIPFPRDLSRLCGCLLTFMEL